MRRRAVLASVPALVAGAGCSAVSPSGRTDTELAEGPPARVEFGSALEYFYGVDTVDLVPPNQAQFAFVRPPESAPAIPPEQYELVLGDERFSPRLPDSISRYRMGQVEEPYTRDERSGWLPFDVPTVDGDAGGLAGGGTRFPIPEQRLPTFATAPAFDVETLTVSDTVRPSGDVVVRASVLNTGDRTGTFRLLARPQPSGPGGGLRILLPPGTSATERTDFRVETEDVEEIHLEVVHSNGHRTFTVSVPATNTPA